MDGWLDGCDVQDVQDVCVDGKIREVGSQKSEGRISEQEFARWRRCEGFSVMEWNVISWNGRHAAVARGDVMARRFIRKSICYI